MIPRKKNSFATFVCSFMPGAAEMYMGFMKNGFTLMLLFILPMALLVIYGGLDFLMPVCVVMWFYGFFHARNYAGMDDEDLAGMEDKYIWEEFSDLKWSRLSNKTIRKWAAAILIIIGVAQIWDYFSDIIYRLIPEGYWDDLYPVFSNIPQVVVAILLVVVGIRLIIGKKRELDIAPDTEVKTMADIAQIEDKSFDSKEA